MHERLGKLAAITIDSPTQRNIERLGKGATALVGRLWAEKSDGKSLSVVRADPKGKWLITRKEIGGRGYDEKYAELTVYPSAEHAGKFARTVHHLQFGGPSEEYPGSVGSVNYEHDEWKREIKVNYAQGTFLQKAKNGEPLVERSVAAKYGGWRQHAFAYLLEYAREKGVHKVFGPRENGVGGKENGNEFLKAAAKLGLATGTERERPYAVTAAKEEAGE